MTPANAPLLSENMSALYESFATYDESGISLNALAVRAICNVLAGMIAGAQQLEQARRERDELLAIAHDMDAVGLVQAGQLGPRIMAPIIADAVAEPSRNVVRFPRPHRQRIVISEQGAGR